MAVAGSIAARTASPDMTGISVTAGFSPFGTDESQQRPGSQGMNSLKREESACSIPARPTAASREGHREDEAVLRRDARTRDQGARRRSPGATSGASRRRTAGPDLPEGGPRASELHDPQLPRG